MTTTDAKTAEMEFPYTCSCGESYTEVQYAAACRKCRNYCVFGYCTHVVDERTGEVVWGEEPSQEEYEARAEIARREWEEEREEWAAYERLEAARLEEEARAEEERAEDALWLAQDELSGIRTR